MDQCCVTGCPSTSNTTRLYNFPADISLTSAWVKLILSNAEEGKILDLGNNATKVCRLHFEDKYFEGWVRTYFAIPTLFSKEEILSKVSSKKITISSEEITPHCVRDIDDDDAEHFIKCVIQLDHSYERSRVKLMSHDETGTKEIHFDLLPSAVLFKSAKKMGMQGKKANDPRRGSNYSQSKPVYTNDTDEQQPGGLFGTPQVFGCMPVQNILQKGTTSPSAPLQRMEIKLKRIGKPPQIANFKPILIQSVFKVSQATEKQPQLNCVNSLPNQNVSSKFINTNEPPRFCKPDVNPSPLPPTTVDKSSIPTPKPRSLVEKRLYKQLNRQTKTIKSLRTKLKDLRKQAKIVNSIKSPTLKDLVEAVAHNHRRKEHGKRWPDSIKSVANNIYRKSPGVYRYMSELFEMPGVATIKKYSKSEPDQADVPAPVLKIRNKNKENALSDLLFKRIKHITRDSTGDTKKAMSLKILIKGDKGVGKSCLLQRLQGGPFMQEYVPSEDTQMAPIQWKPKNLDLLVRVNAWDVVDTIVAKKMQPLGLRSGNQSTQSATEDDAYDHQWKCESSSLNLYKNANAVILMMDITKPQTYEYVEQEISRVPAELPVLILGNHCDLSHLRRVHPHHIERLLQQARLDRMAPVLYTESSMHNGFGLRLLHKFLDVPLLRVQCASLLEKLQRCQREAEQLEQEIALFQNSEEAHYDTFVEGLKQVSRPAQPQRLTEASPSYGTDPTETLAVQQKATKRKAETIPTERKPEYVNPSTYRLLKPTLEIGVETIPSSQAQRHSASNATTAAVGALDEFYAGTLSCLLDDSPVAAKQELFYPSDSEDCDVNSKVIVQSTRSSILPAYKSSNEAKKLKKHKDGIGTAASHSSGLSRVSGMSMPSLENDEVWAGHTSAKSLPEGRN